MASKKDNLPLNVAKDDDATSTITYANEVIAIIAGVAANEVEGIAGMCTSGGFSDILGRNRNITRGVKVEIGSEEASVDLYVIIEYGTPIQEAASDAQENVRKAIETMTGLHVVRVDVHVQGVSFEQENKALESGQKAALDAGDAPKPLFKTELVENEEEEEKPEAPTSQPEPIPEPQPEPPQEAIAEETQPAPAEEPQA